MILRKRPASSSCSFATGHSTGSRSGCTMQPISTARVWCGPAILVRWKTRNSGATIRIGPPGFWSRTIGRPNWSRIKTNPRPALLQLRHWYVERYCIHHSFALELHPDSIGAGPREDQVELHLRTAVGKERMFVDGIHQIVARGQHVRPSAQPFLHAVGGFEMEEQQGLHASDRLRRVH